jgi:transcriptional regulator with XRE-family HTH domain
MLKNNDKGKEPFLGHLGDAIRVRRTSLLLSQEQLGVRADLHRTYVTDIENGLRNVSLMTLMRVVKALESKLSSPILAAEKAMVVRKHNKKR